MRKNLLSLLILSSAILLLPALSWTEEKETKSFQGLEFFTGFAGGKLQEKGNYHLIPVMVDFDFDLKPLAQKLNFHPAQLLQAQIEPFIAFVSEPDTNMEMGISFLFKVGILSQTAKFQPYIKVGGRYSLYDSPHPRTIHTI